MVSNLEIYPLIEIVRGLSVVYYKVKRATHLMSVGVDVRGENGIVEPMKVIQPKIAALAEKYPQLSYISGEIQNLVVQLEQHYGDPKAFISKTIVLGRNDANELERSISGWFNQIFGVYSKSPTVMIDVKQLQQMVKELSNILDEQTKKDLMDAYECILNNLPTPAVMLLYRISEAKVKEFYKKEMQHDPPEGSTMGSMAKDLREKQTSEIESKIRKKTDPLIHYILHQTDKRNDAQHPGERYEPKEAEEIFIFVKKLIEDIHERL